MNIVVTSTTNSIKVDFGDYSEVLGVKKSTWIKSRVRFRLKHNNDFVEVLIVNENGFSVTFDGAGDTLQIDTVDGIAPTSNSDLYDKLIGLIS